MKIRIYQVNLERDTDRFAFMGSDFLIRKRGGLSLESSIYDSVFEGTVECESLEDVYKLFNLSHPAGYKARSLSVSDVVEVMESDTVKTGFYFCDSVGFQEVSFDTSGTQKSERFCDFDHLRTIEALLVQPDKPPRLIQIEDSLAAMQTVVGGDIEEYMPFADDVALICNEEGKVNGLPLNRAIYAEPIEVDGCNKKGDSREIIDIIAGDFLIVAAPLESSRYESLTPELAKKYQEKFKNPERFFRTDSGIKAVPYKPISKGMER